AAEMEESVPSASSAFICALPRRISSPAATAAPLIASPAATAAPLKCWPASPRSAFIESVARPLLSGDIAFSLGVGGLLHGQVAARVAAQHAQHQALR